MHRDSLEWPTLEDLLQEPMDWGGGSGGGWDDEPPPPPPPPGLREAWVGPDADTRPPEPTQPVFPEKSTLKGVFVARCCPPHLGHLRALTEASRLCSSVDLVMRVSATDPIPASVRSRWVSQTVSHVFFLEHEHESSRASLREALGERLRGYRFLFSLDAADEELAWALGLHFVKLDGLPGVDTAAVERDPLAHWSLLTEQAQAHLRLIVSVVGPEGTGKTALARSLAARLATLCVPDGRSLAAPQGGPLSPEQLARAVRLSATLRPGLAPFAGPVLVQDGDVCSFAYESYLRYEGQSFELLDEELRTPAAHLYLVTDAEPYRGLSEHDDPARRAAIRDRWDSEMRSRGLPCVVLRGSDGERLAQAAEAVDALLQEQRDGAAG